MCYFRDRIGQSDRNYAQTMRELETVHHNVQALIHSYHNQTVPLSTVEALVEARRYLSIAITAFRLERMP